MRLSYFPAQGKREAKNPKKTPAAGLSDVCGFACTNFVKSVIISSRDGAGCFTQIKAFARCG